jgi:hypothetical protein
MKQIINLNLFKYIFLNSHTTEILMIIYNIIIDG